MMAKMRRVFTGFVELRDLFPWNVDLSCNDGGSSNIKRELNMQETSTIPRWRISCEAHLVSTVQGRSFTVIGTTISGLIAYALAQRDAGAVPDLRTCADVSSRGASIFPDVNVFVLVFEYLVLAGHRLSDKSVARSFFHAFGSSDCRFTLERQISSETNTR